jgi:hypothetical protein
MAWNFKPKKNYAPLNHYAPLRTIWLLSTIIFLPQFSQNQFLKDISFISPMLSAVHNGNRTPVPLPKDNIYSVRQESLFHQLLCSWILVSRWEKSLLWLCGMLPWIPWRTYVFSQEFFIAPITPPVEIPLYQDLKTIIWTRFICR